MTSYVASEALVDILLEDDEGLVLVGDTLLRLGPVGVVVVRACATAPRSLTELIELATQAFGSPDGGDAGSIVAASVDSLVDADVLRRHPEE